MSPLLQDYFKNRLSALLVAVAGAGRGDGELLPAAAFYVPWAAILVRRQGVDGPAVDDELPVRAAGPHFLLEGFHVPVGVVKHIRNLRLGTGKGRILVIDSSRSTITVIGLQ